jgi:hypothetical protein
LKGQMLNGQTLLVGNFVEDGFHTVGKLPVSTALRY